MTLAEELLGMADGLIGRPIALGVPSNNPITPDRHKFIPRLEGLFEANGVIHIVINEFTITCRKESLGHAAFSNGTGNLFLYIRDESMPFNSCLGITIYMED